MQPKSLSRLYLQILLLIESARFIRSTTVQEDPEFKAAIDSAKTVLENIEVKLNFRKAEGLEKHGSAEETCDWEKSSKLARKDRVNARLQEIDTLVYHAVDQQTMLQTKIQKLEEEISGTKQSLDDSAAQVESLDKESQKTDAAHEEMIGTLKEAIVTLEGAGESTDEKSGEDVALEKEAGMFLAERLGALEKGTASSTSPGMDVVVGALKGMQDKVTHQRAEDMEKYITTRANTVALIKTCEKDLEEQTKEQDQFESQLVNVTQTLSNNRREKIVLQTKIKGNEDVLDAYVDFCKDDLSVLAQRHRHRIDKVLQKVLFAKAAVVNARLPSIFLQKKQDFFDPRQLFESKIPHLLSGPQVQHSPDDASQRPLLVAKKIVNPAQRFRKHLERLPENTHHLNTFFQSAQELHQSVASILKPKPRASKSSILRCRENGTPPKEPALLAASWALQDAASQLRSRALHRTACEVRFRTPYDARNLLTMLANSLQRGVATVHHASSSQEDDDCLAKDLVHKAEMRGAQEELKKAQEEASKTELFMREYQVEKTHLETYVPKLQHDMDALVSHSSVFDELYSGDEETASEVRTLLSGVIEEVNAVKAVGPDKPLADLDEAIAALSSAARKDLKEAKAGIGIVQQKLNKRRHLMKTWDEWLQKATGDQEAKLAELIAERDKAKKAVEDLEASAPPQCQAEGVALFAHLRQAHDWAREVEIAAVQLALSLLSGSKHDVTTGG